MSSALLRAISQQGLTVQQQNAVERRIETASMEQINYRVGSFPVGAGCCILQTDYKQRLFPPGLALVASSTFEFADFPFFILFLPVFRMGLELHVSIYQQLMDTLAC